MEISEALFQNLRIILVQRKKRNVGTETTSALPQVDTVGFGGRSLVIYFRHRVQQVNKLIGLYKLYSVNSSLS